MKPIHGGLSRVFSMATSSSSWCTFFLSFLAFWKSHQTAQLEYATPTTVELFLRTRWPLCRSLLLLLLLSLVSLVLAPCTSASSSRVFSLKARSRTPRKSKKNPASFGTEGAWRCRTRYFGWWKRLQVWCFCSSLFDDVFVCV